MCLEMPDHPDDIRWTYATVQSQGMPTTTVRGTGLVSQTSGGFFPVYAQLGASNRAMRIMQKLSVAGTVPLVPVQGWETTNANSELLYLIIEDSTMNGSSAMELFGRTEVGDTDKDGFNEFLDAYGRPIQWVRWPSGFPSTLRYHPDLLDPALIDPVTKVSRFSGDSIDRMKVDPGLRPNASGDAKVLIPDIGTFPLVVSPGVDGVFGQRFELDPSTIPTPVNGYALSGSRSVRDVFFPTPYGIASTPDPWYPRPRPPLSNDDLSIYRLGAVINPTAFKDDVTNFDINGASQ